MKTVEPKQSYAPKCQTPFSEKSGDRLNQWLGNPRWRQIPVGAFPSRERIQQIVSDDERAEAARILKELREAEKVAAQHDIGRRTARILALEGTSGQAPDLSVQEAELLRREREKCDPALFNSAQETIRASRDAAVEMARAILLRCINSFQSELEETALLAEARLAEMGIPLFEDRMVNGYPYRDWTLWSDQICTALHARREVCRNLWIWTGPTMEPGRGLSFIAFACTNEDLGAYCWL
ncbi:MAG TPA: hypothetical protein VIS96_10955 [Terrimicrobiaceae bacterium]